MRRALAVIALIALTASACGGGSDDAFDIGIKRVALALAFSEEDLVVPARPEVIIRVIPAPPGVTAADLGSFQTPPPAIPSLFPPCTKAPANAAPAAPVTYAVSKPPPAGRYLRHNKGSIEVTGGAFPLTLPFPPISTWDVRAARQVTVPPPAGVGEPATYTEYEIHKLLAPGFTTIDRIRIEPPIPEQSDVAPGRLLLVQRTTTNQDTTKVFKPDPAIELYRFGTEGTTWSSAGVDLENGTSMLLQGATVRREVIDVCGTVYDSYRVEVTERVVDLATGETSGTADGDVDVYNIATHLGGLILHEDVHQTATTTDPDTGAPLIIELEYVSTVNTVAPPGSGA